MVAPERRPRRRRRVTKAERLQQLLELNQKDGRRSGLMRPVSWGMNAAALLAGLFAGFVVVQAMMVPGADWARVSVTALVAAGCGLAAGWAHMMNDALHRSSVRAKEEYFAVLGRPVPSGWRIRPGAVRRWAATVARRASRR